MRSRMPRPRLCRDAQTIRNRTVDNSRNNETLTLQVTVPQRKKFASEIDSGSLGPSRSPRYDACSAGFPIGSGPRTVARCGKRSQLLRLPYPGSNFARTARLLRFRTAPAPISRLIACARERAQAINAEASALGLEPGAPALRIDIEARED